MTLAVNSASARWYIEGPQAPQIRTVKSAGGILDLLEIDGVAGDVSRPASPDIVLYQEMVGGCHIRGDLGGGRVDRITKKGEVVLAAPDFATTTIININHRVRSLVFPIGQWRSMLDEAGEGGFSFGNSGIYGRMLGSSTIRSALRHLWSLSADEGAPSRLLARAAGCEILAEWCRLGGTPFAPSKGGLAPWAKQRTIDLMHARLADDISLDELAAEARLSPFHFARMFKQSVGVPPRVYLTQLRIEKACELLEKTDLPVTDIAFEVGYSSNQVLARVFLKQLRMSPSDYRRARRDPFARLPGDDT
ncbi:helix-turn-helix domain-containing protein [Salinarimonas soli]|uniref:Helix-turn-helix transcriptional regulator n=1 Tax=Salinarimonas soli TaxID=1638099 RepID=A0A5B2V829_9HYPH|nr:AraC family transcriptional regulator [Salinarimonas soli]KAA2234592.1 helix-turn-helix transcriptional regulator [Salinarimonas soli]